MTTSSPSKRRRSPASVGPPTAGEPSTDDPPDHSEPLSPFLPSHCLSFQCYRGKPCVIDYWGNPSAFTDVIVNTKVINMPKFFLRGCKNLTVFVFDTLTGS